jgi:hypothetical protein
MNPQKRSNPLKAASVRGASSDLLMMGPIAIPLEAHQTKKAMIEQAIIPAKWTAKLFARDTSNAELIQPSSATTSSSDQT